MGLTMDDLATWADRIGEHDHRVWVGKGISVADVKDYVNSLLREVDAMQTEIDELYGRLNECA